MSTFIYPKRCPCLPEELELSYTSTLSLKEIEFSRRHQKPLCAIVESYNLSAKCFKVRLSDEFTAILPFTDSVIQDFIAMTKDGDDGIIHAGMYTNAMTNRKIKVHVSKITSNGIYVTRKIALNDAYKKITKYISGKNTVFRCSVLSNSSKTVFVDIGGGILGAVAIADLSFVHYADINKWISQKDEFFACLVKKTEDRRFNLSRKEFYAHDGSAFSFKYGDMPVVKISQAVPKGDGYYVEITPGIAGVMDSKKVRHEGQETIGIIHKIVPDSKVPCGFKFRLYET